MPSGPEPGTAAEHFSPTENLEQIDRDHLLHARKSIDIAMYAFTDLYLAQAIVERARDGVQVRIYRDNDQYNQEQRRSSGRRESTTNLLGGERNIQIRVKGSRELMHLKAYLIDGRELRTGSANWSPSGEKRQDNNAHFTTDPQQVKAFQNTFEEMWQRPNNQLVR